MALPKPLRCSEVGRESLLMALIARLLDPAVEDQVLEHLRQCPHCLSMMAKVIDMAEWIYSSDSHSAHDRQ